MKLKTWLPLVASFLVATCIIQFAFGGDKPLDRIHVKQIAPCRFVGTYYEPEKTIFYGEAIEGEISAGGAFFMKWRGGRWPTGRYDKARWWTHGATWCRKFVELSNGRPACYSVRQRDMYFTFFNSSGKKAFEIACSALIS